MDGEELPSLSRAALGGGHPSSQRRTGIRTCARACVHPTRLVRTSIIHVLPERSKRQDRRSSYRSACRDIKVPDRAGCKSSLVPPRGIPMNRSPERLLPSLLKGANMEKKKPIPSHTIRVDDEVYEFLKSRAVPFQDNPNSILRWLLFGDKFARAYDRSGRLDRIPKKKGGK